MIQIQDGYFRRLLILPFDACVASATPSISRSLPRDPESGGSDLVQTFFERSFAINRLRQGPLAGHIDLLAARLATDGYSRVHSRIQLRLIGHFNRWLEKKDLTVEQIDEQIIERYWRYFMRKKRVRSLAGTQVVHETICGRNMVAHSFLLVAAGMAHVSFRSELDGLDLAPLRDRARRRRCRSTGRQRNTIATTSPLSSEGIVICVSRRKYQYPAQVFKSL
jgi:hypothetical protein